MKSLDQVERHLRLTVALLEGAHLTGMSCGLLHREKSVLEWVLGLIDAPSGFAGVERIEENVARIRLQLKR